MNKLLAEGLTDAAGFLGGAVLGYAVAMLAGLNIFAEGYGAGSIGGILLVGLGGGAGVHLARRWRATRAKGK